MDQYQSNGIIKIKYQYDLFSVFIAVTNSLIGCYTTFSILQSIRYITSAKVAIFLICLSSISISLLGVWSTHFLYLNAMVFENSEIFYLNIKWTAVSLVVGILMNIFGFYISYSSYYLSVHETFDAKLKIHLENENKNENYKHNEKMELKDDIQNGEEVKNKKLDKIDIFDASNNEILKNENNKETFKISRINHLKDRISNTYIEVQKKVYDINDLSKKQLTYQKINISNKEKDIDLNNNPSKKDYNNTGNNRNNKSNDVLKIIEDSNLIKDFSFNNENQNKPFNNIKMYESLHIPIEEKEKENKSIIKNYKPNSNKTLLDNIIIEDEIDDKQMNEVDSFDLDFSNHFMNFPFSSKNYISMIIGGLIMGSSILSLHIVGMKALEFEGVVNYFHKVQIAISVIGILASCSIHIVFFYHYSNILKIVMTIVFTIAVALIHGTSVYFTSFEKNIDVDYSFVHQNKENYKLIETTKYVVIINSSFAYIFREILNYFMTSSNRIVIDLENYLDNDNAKVSYIRHFLNFYSKKLK